MIDDDRNNDGGESMIMIDDDNDGIIYGNDDDYNTIGDNTDGNCNSSHDSMMMIISYLLVALTASIALNNARLRLHSFISVRILFFKINKSNGNANELSCVTSGTIPSQYF